MSLSKCQRSTTDSRIKVEEKGKKAVFLNDSRETYLKTQHDQCLVSHALASDWVISKDSVGDVIVELKGKDIDHATEQVLSTAQHWVSNELTHGHLAGLIVGTQYPRFDTKVRRGKENFTKRFRGPLHVVTRNCEFQFERVLSFQGPL